MFAGASNPARPKQKWHQREVFGGLDDGSVQILRRSGIALLYEIDDFHQIGGCLIRPPNGLHGLGGALRAWPAP